MTRHRCVRLGLLSLLFLITGFSSLAQTFTYPFDNGRADLPLTTCVQYAPTSATYTLLNPTNTEVDVILFQEVDEIDVYRINGLKRTLLGRSGWLYPAHLLQLDQYPEFGFQHRNGVLFQLPPAQTVHLQAVYRNKMFANTALLYPRLFSRAGYQQFLDRQLAAHLPVRMLGMIFVGCLLIMFLYTGTQYIILRERVLLYYALFVLLVILRSVIHDDYLHVMDGWPLLRSVGFVSRFSLTFMLWSLAAYGLFLREYVQLRARSPKLDHLYAAMISVFILLGLGDVFITVDKFTVPVWQQVHRAVDVCLLLFGFFTLYTLWRFYDAVTKFLFWGILFFFISGLGSIINRSFFGYLPTVYDTEVAIFATGYVLEILMFALGIAQRHELIRQEKVSIQAQLIEQLQHNEQKQVKLNTLRDEIARDLHDEIGSQLSSISILSQTTARYISDERAKQRLSTIGQTARQIMESMREIVWSLNSSSDSLQHVGLRIRETAYNLFADTPTRLHIDLAETDAVHGLSQKQRRELHMIAKECLINCLRHAQAQNVWLMLQATPPTVLFSIRDDGMGFDQTTDFSGLGLRSIQARANQIGAILSIESNPGAGTVIRVNCPTLPESERSTPSAQQTTTLSAMS
ncbi:sensor histidine kinase [Spirosoma validum]|uniref:histidine kinase n=1 Tax=Spirosoma validum TaxID=2771355 RepID=A0A927B494_9BACT|nr:7TM diverse intracellular signaling domain-containing protein [Spirosoma validum]MBD2755360.1 hypothetical protein [Spirosoma validum]